MAFSGNGLGTIESPYEITTAAQLNEVRNELGAHYKLMTSIDLSTYSTQEHTDEIDPGMPAVVIATGWDPIGNYHQPFTGSFDGQNYTINNLVFNRAGLSFNGLFGCALDANVSNLKFDTFDITGGYRTQVCVGYLRGETITSNISLISGNINE